MGHTEPAAVLVVAALEAIKVVVVAPVTALSDTLVGRTGAAAVPVLDIGGQVGEPQARSVGQQPPPKLDGQVWYPVVQLCCPCTINVDDGAGFVEGVTVIVWMTVVAAALVEGYTIMVVVTVCTDKGFGTDAAVITSVIVVVEYVEAGMLEIVVPAVTVATGRVVVVICVPTRIPICY